MEIKKEISYSIDALRVKARFYGKKAMVYVEGPEDINFWDPYFERDVFEIESVNGCQNLVPYITLLETGEKSFIVACDSDYNWYKKQDYESPLIVTTYGHSIENMMYCPYNINEIVRKLSKTNVDSIDKINEWYKNFVKSAHPLLLREILNQIYKPQEDKPKVFGNSSARFCKENKCYELDDLKINSYCEKIKKSYPQEELNNIESLITKDPREERQLIKGHFYTDAIQKYIEYLSKNLSNSKNIKIPNAALYALFVHCTQCKQQNCKEKEHLQNVVEKAKLQII